MCITNITVYFLGCSILVESYISLESRFSRVFLGFICLIILLVGGRSADVKSFLMHTCSLRHFFPEYSFSPGFRDIGTQICTTSFNGVTTFIHSCTECMLIMPCLCLSIGNTAFRETNLKNLKKNYPGDLQVDLPSLSLTAS